MTVKHTKQQQTQSLSTQKERDIDVVVGPEARGFIIGCPVSYALEVGFAPVRKLGKITT